MFLTWQMMKLCSEVSGYLTSRFNTHLKHAGFSGTFANKPILQFFEGWNEIYANYFLLNHLFSNTLDFAPYFDCRVANMPSIENVKQNLE